MDSLVQAPRAPVHRSLLRFIHDRNPFYLLSALSMFVGFRVILGALDSAPGDWKTLLRLIVTLNVYEAVMIGLALFLIVRRGLRRDGWILLAIDALFLVDLTNLNAELYTATPRLGTVVNAVCFLLAMAKILIVVRTLRLRLSPGTTLYIAAQLAFLLGLPGIFRLLRSPAGIVTPMQIYAVWWMAALLIAGGAVMVKRSHQNDASPFAPLPWRLYILMPLVSLLVHLCSENRVYWVHFHPANVAPVLLALVVVLNRSQLRWHPRALAWSMSLVVLALAVSVVPETYHAALTARHFGAAVSPLRVELIVSSLLLLSLAFRHRSIVAANVSASCAVMAGLGAHPTDMARRALTGGRWLLASSKQLVPETSLQWGYVAIGAAFLLLAVGAVFSLRKGAPPVEHEPMV